MAGIVRFEIPADDVERAKHFYATLFGWTYHSYEGQREYVVVSTGTAERPAVEGAILRRTGPAPQAGAAVAGFVPLVEIDEDPDAFARRVAEVGGIAEERREVTGVGWTAYFRDPDGNRFGVLRYDEAAR